MEMMKKLLNAEELSYTSNLNAAHLKKKLEDLFKQNSLRIGGRITGENEFTAYDKLVVIGWNNPDLKRKSAYLKGIIKQGEKGSIINLKVQPNSILPVFAFLAILFGVLITVIAFSTAGKDTFLLLFGFVFLALGVFYYPLSTLFRNRLRNKLVKYLDLNKG